MVGEMFPWLGGLVDAMRNGVIVVVGALLVAVVSWLAWFWSTGR